MNKKIYKQKNQTEISQMSNQPKIRKQNSNMVPISFEIKFRKKPQKNILDNKGYISFKI